jgi:hypothetical protein
MVQAIFCWLARIRGYTGEVAPAVIERAAEAAFGPSSRRRGAVTAIRAVQPGRAIGGNVEAVVRHHFGDGRTLIRKTFRGTAPREVLVFRSGLLDAGGCWWRAPRLYLAEEEGTGRWHLFLEDLGRTHWSCSPTALAAASHALGEHEPRPALLPGVARIDSSLSWPGISTTSSGASQTTASRVRHATTPPGRRRRCSRRRRCTSGGPSLIHTTAAWLRCACDRPEVRTPNTEAEAAVLPFSTLRSTLPLTAPCGGASTSRSPTASPATCCGCASGARSLAVRLRLELITQ